MGAAAALNIGLNVFWIPAFGARGAALSTLVTEGFVALGYWTLLFARQQDKRLILCLLPASLGAVAVLTTSSIITTHIGSAFDRAFVLAGLAACAVVVGNLVAAWFGFET